MDTIILYTFLCNLFLFYNLFLSHELPLSIPLTHNFLCSIIRYVVKNTTNFKLFCWWIFFILLLLIFFGNKCATKTLQILGFLKANIKIIDKYSVVQCGGDLPYVAVKTLTNVCFKLACVTYIEHNRWDLSNTRS